MDDKPIIYTVGHSTHQLDYFLELLTEYSVNCVVDVRSVAASSYNPQYNKEPLSNFLKNNQIRYLHFAEEFGARHSDPDLLDNDGRGALAVLRCCHSASMTQGHEQKIKIEPYITAG